MEHHSELRTKESQGRIVKAIEEAEFNTSGEIRVHIESTLKGDPVERAVLIFNKLKMGDTVQKNGVLIYVAYDSHKLSIIGDIGINEKVPSTFWNEIISKLSADFASGNFTDGVCRAVLSVGDSLKTLFPYQSDDVNEKSNEVSFGE